MRLETRSRAEGPAAGVKTGSALTTSADIDRNGLMPDALALLDDLETSGYLFGIDNNWWRETRWDFPHVYFEVHAADRVGAPERFLFQFECSRYPTQAPLCLQWDSDTDGQAATKMRPKGCGRVGIVFRTDWEAGRYLYTPLDRHAVSSHNEWLNNFPRTIWRPTSSITRYLTELHDLLTSRDYSGVVGE